MASILTFAFASPKPEQPSAIFSASAVQTSHPLYQNGHWSYFDRLGQLMTSPQHAWWKKVLPKRDNPSRSSVQKVKKRNGDGSISAVDSTVVLNVTTIILPTPTFCSYMPSNSDCNTGCLCQSFCGSIYITNYTRLAAVNANEPNASLGPNYHICVNWQLNYPAQLSYAFQEAGFAVLPEQPYQCGWQTLGSVSALRVSRGSIDVNGTLEYDQGDPAELAAIFGVLRAEYPFVEILVVCATMVGPLCILLGYCVWTVTKPPYKDQNRSRGLYRRL